MSARAWQGRPNPHSGMTRHWPRGVAQERTRVTAKDRAILEAALTAAGLIPVAIPHLYADWKGRRVNLHTGRWTDAGLRADYRRRRRARARRSR